MTSIDKLIYDALVARRGVILTGVGTLEVKRRGAKKISETQIIPPQNVVVFTPDEIEGATPVASLVAAETGVSEPEAVALYGSWLEGAQQSDGSVAIEGVGELGERGIVVTGELHTALNPTNEEIVTMETERSSTPLWAWIIIGLLAALLVLVALWGWKGGLFGSVRQPAPETLVVTVSEPVEGYSEIGASTSSDPAAPAAPAAEAVPAPAPEPQGPLFHVIGGAFSIESNADKFIERLKREHPELTTKKMVNPKSGYHMVSIFSSPNQREAYNKMNLYWDIDLYLWIYREN